MSFATAMTTNRKNTADLSMMTHVPLQPHWLVQLPAFQSSDARIVRAGLHMLLAAFHGQPAGTLPCTPEAIATASHLSVQEVHENFKLLISGWKKSKDTISFEPMAQMAMRLSTDYGEALRQLQDSVSVAIAAPDLFNSELLPTQGLALESQVSGKTLEKARDMLGQTKTLRLLPEDCVITPQIREILVQNHFTADVHEEIWEMFVDYHKSNGIRSANWTSHFRNWLRNKQFYGRLSPSASSVTEPPRQSRTRHTFNFNNSKPGGNFFNRGEAAKMQASSSLDRAQRAIAEMRNRQVINVEGGAQ